jgi:hypothetical protein
LEGLKSTRIGTKAKGGLEIEIEAAFSGTARAQTGVGGCVVLARNVLGEEIPQ